MRCSGRNRDRRCRREEVSGHPLRTAASPLPEAQSRSVSTSLQFLFATEAQSHGEKLDRSKLLSVPLCLRGGCLRFPISKCFHATFSRGYIPLFPGRCECWAARVSLLLSAEKLMS